MVQRAAKARYTRFIIFSRYNNGYTSTVSCITCKHVYHKILVSKTKTLIICAVLFGCLFLFLFVCVSGSAYSGGQAPVPFDACSWYSLR